MSREAAPENSSTNETAWVDPYAESSRSYYETLDAMFDQMGWPKEFSPEQAEENLNRLRKMVGRVPSNEELLEARENLWSRDDVDLITPQEDFKSP